MKYLKQKNIIKKKGGTNLSVEPIDICKLADSTFDFNKILDIYNSKENNETKTVQVKFLASGGFGSVNLFKHNNTTFTVKNGDIAGEMNFLNFIEEKIKKENKKIKKEDIYNHIVCMKEEQVNTFSKIYNDGEFIIIMENLYDLYKDFLSALFIKKDNEGFKNYSKNFILTTIDTLLKSQEYLNYTLKCCHNDIKPDNILFKKIKDLNNKISFTPKFIDLGLCDTLNSEISKNKVLENKKNKVLENESDSKEYIEKEICGTLLYNCPLSAEGYFNVIAKDSWAMGCTIYEMIAKCGYIFKELDEQKSNFLKIEFVKEHFKKRIVLFDFLITRESTHQLVILNQIYSGLSSLTTKHIEYLVCLNEQNSENSVDLENLKNIFLGMKIHEKKLIETRENFKCFFKKSQLNKNDKQNLKKTILNLMTLSLNLKEKIKKQDSSEKNTQDSSEKKILNSQQIESENKHDSSKEDFLKKIENLSKNSNSIGGALTVTSKLTTSKILNLPKKTLTKVTLNINQINKTLSKKSKFVLNPDLEFASNQLLEFEKLHFYKDKETQELQELQQNFQQNLQQDLQHLQEDFDKIKLESVADVINQLKSEIENNVENIGILFSQTLDKPQSTFISFYFFLLKNLKKTNEINFEQEAQDLILDLDKNDKLNYALILYKKYLYSRTSKSIDIIQKEQIKKDTILKVYDSLTPDEVKEIDKNYEERVNCKKIKYIDEITPKYSYSDIKKEYYYL